MTATHDDIIKSERRGRLCYTQEQRNALVNACKASGLSTPRFAAIHGVRYQTLAAWIHQRNLEAKPVRPCSQQPASLILVPVERDGPTSSGVSGAMEITLPGGSTLLVTAPGLIPLAAALIRELAKPLPC